MTIADRISSWLRPVPGDALVPIPQKGLSPVNGLPDLAGPSKAVTNLYPWNAGPPLGGIYSREPQELAALYLRTYKVGWFYKAESKISRDLANLSVSVAPEDDSGDNERDVIEPDLFTPWEQLDPIGQFLRLMERPNPNQTGRALRQKTQIRKDLAGWAYWYLENGSFGLPTAIYGISPSRLWPSVDKSGNLIGWILDKDKPSGGMPFSVNEIIAFSNVTTDDSDLYGQGVVEAVYSQTTLTDQLAKHTSDLLHTGGRLAGMLWPKERALSEAEYEDAVRAWRNVASDPNAARRLLLFPEPMEWSQGAANPAEIGIPELGAWTRDEILTAFPISPYQLGVPMPGGLNSAETRKQDRRDYWEGTMHPRVEDFEETIQVHLLSRYEEVLGTTFDFEIDEPSLDDAPTLIEKAGAMDALVGLGFDPKATVEAVGLDHIKWVALPALKDPAVQAQMAKDAAQAAQQQPQLNESTSVNAATDRARPTVQAKAISQAEQDAKDALVPEVALALDRLTRFFNEQRARVEDNLRKTLPQAKSARVDAIKANPEWWDAATEDDELFTAMRAIYVQVGRKGLQAVSDRLERTASSFFVKRVYADLLEYGGARIKDINERTLQALTLELAEGTRRGYSISQLIDGVPDEGYKGVAGLELDNGTPAFDELRAETIARTETALSYNRATVVGYDSFGVKYLQAYDGDGDEECAARDGEEFSIDDALAIEDHPNGTLVWSPVVDR